MMQASGAVRTEAGSSSPIQVRYMDAHVRRAAMMEYAHRVKDDNLKAVGLAEERIRYRVRPNGL